MKVTELLLHYRAFFFFNISWFKQEIKLAIKNQLEVGAGGSHL
jgi:hypothetical protein